MYCIIWLSSVCQFYGVILNVSFISKYRGLRLNSNYDQIILFFIYMIYIILLIIGLMPITTCNYSLPYPYTFVAIFSTQFILSAMASFYHFNGYQIDLESIPLNEKEQKLPVDKN